MEQVKIFYQRLYLNKRGVEINQLEEQINTWLESMGDKIEIISRRIHSSGDEDTVVIVSVFYRPR